MNPPKEKNKVSFPDPGTMPFPDPEEAVGSVSNVGVGLIVLFILMYLGLNIAGSLYCSKLLKLGKANSGQKGGAIASVVIGWLICPLVNITSIIMYKTMK
jgi:membrane associated rhomboid family serine protease